jgi:hypothetical protein
MGRSNGLTSAEAAQIAQVRAYFQLPPVPTEANSRIVGILVLESGERIPIHSGESGGPWGGTQQGGIPRGPGSGADRYTLRHVEGHAAAIMQTRGILRAWLLIELPPCPACGGYGSGGSGGRTPNLAAMLPGGGQLLVIDPVDATYFRSTTAGQARPTPQPPAPATTPPPRPVQPGEGTTTGGARPPQQPTVPARPPPPPQVEPPSTSTSPGMRVAAGALGIFVVINEILGAVNRVRGVQQYNIDVGNAQLAFWTQFGAHPTRGVWDQTERHPLPPTTTPSTSFFGSASFAYVVDIDVSALETALPQVLRTYQDLMYFLDAAKTLGLIEERPPMPQYPDRQQATLSRQYYAWVDHAENRRAYDITDLILRIRQRTLTETETSMRDQRRGLSSQEQANIFRLKNGSETRIYRSADGAQPIITAQQIFGPDPWVRTIGQQRDVGGLFSTRMRSLVVPANADAQRAALISGYWVHQPIEDTFEEIRRSGRPVLDRQPPDGVLNSFVAGPEPGATSRFGQTRYYRHPDPGIRWTIALGELRQFWVDTADLEAVPIAQVTA